MRGYGKTTLFKSLFTNAKNSPAFVQQKVLTRVIDPLMELQDLGGEFLRRGDRVESNKIIKEAFARKNTFLCYDEADLFFPNKKTLTNAENDFIQIGRHWGLGGMFVTRRLSRLHTDIVSQANKLFIFHLFSSADMQYLNESGFGDYLDTIGNLQKFEFLVVDMDANEIYVSPPI